uniref:Receptor expression-enhancing protein n=1 Tax=Caenorhabditis tropicalis TaxID=1561998 RepID=A0A1I7TSG9_9PELO
MNMAPHSFLREEVEDRNTFYLGICVLFGWMVFILICARPHLFRDYLKKWFKPDGDIYTEKVRKAEARLQETLRLAQKPSNFLVDQAAVMSAMATRNENKETRITLGLVEEEDEEESCS